MAFTVPLIKALHIGHLLSTCAQLVRATKCPHGRKLSQSVHPIISYKSADLPGSDFLL